MSASKIEWTEETWNPVTGCDKVSPGCKNCYAEALARRLKAMGVSGYADGFKVTLHPDRLHEPLQKRRPTMYFVNSMSDLFHESVPDDFLAQVFETMHLATEHTFQVLTKRPDRMLSFCKSTALPENIWLGVSVENKEHGLPRIDVLRAVSAHVRFLSIEPLLEDLGAFDLTGIQWVIVGGESGPKARPMNINWVESIQRQCRTAGVPFFFKQWGQWGADGLRRSKKANGRSLRGNTFDEMPLFLSNRENASQPV